MHLHLLPNDGQIKGSLKNTPSSTLWKRKAKPSDDWACLAFTLHIKPRTKCIVINILKSNATHFTKRSVCSFRQCQRWDSRWASQRAGWIPLRNLLLLLKQRSAGPNNQIYECLDTSKNWPGFHGSCWSSSSSHHWYRPAWNGAQSALLELPAFVFQHRLHHPPFLETHCSLERDQRFSPIQLLDQWKTEQFACVCIEDIPTRPNIVHKI